MEADADIVRKMFMTEKKSPNLKCGYFYNNKASNDNVKTMRQLYCWFILNALIVSLSATAGSCFQRKSCKKPSVHDLLSGKQQTDLLVNMDTLSNSLGTL